MEEVRAARSSRLPMRRSRGVVSARGGGQAVAVFDEHDTVAASLYQLSKARRAAGDERGCIDAVALKLAATREDDGANAAQAALAECRFHEPHASSQVLREALGGRDDNQNGMDGRNSRCGTDELSHLSADSCRVLLSIRHAGSVDHSNLFATLHLALGCHRSEGALSLECCSTQQRVGRF